MALDTRQRGHTHLVDCVLLDAEMFVLESAGDGDYERIAISGMAGAIARVGNVIQLARCGPFVPPMSITADSIVITNTMLSALHTSPFKEWSVATVEKTQIVMSEWDGSDFVSAPGDPEDFILNSPHDEACAQSLGDLWEIVLPVGCTAKGFKVSVNRSSMLIESVTYVGGDLFFIQFPGGRSVACSSSFRSWIDSQPSVSKWLRFIPAEFKRFSERK